MALSACGGAMGFLSGLLGVGGGFVAVPALRAITALSMQSAVATSLMTIMLTSAGAVAMLFVKGTSVTWNLALPFVVGTLAGMLIGRRVAPKLAGPALQKGFAALLIAVALKLLHFSV